MCAVGSHGHLPGASSYTATKSPIGWSWSWRPFSAESSLPREAVQLKQTLELGEHVRREIEKEQMKKDTQEGMMS